MIAEAVAEARDGLAAALPAAIAAVQAAGGIGAARLPATVPVQVSRHQVDERTPLAVLVEQGGDVAQPLPAEAMEQGVDVLIDCRCVVPRERLASPASLTDEDVTATARALARAVAVAARAHFDRRRARGGVAFTRPTAITIAEPDLETEPGLQVVAVTITLPAYDMVVLTAPEA